MHLSAGAPVLIRTLRYCDGKGRRVMAGHTVHRGDLVRYSLNVPLSPGGVGADSGAKRNGVHDD